MTWSSNEFENDPFEVVRDDFKSDFHKFHTSTGLGLKNSENNVTENGCDSDSGDTDEITAMKKVLVRSKTVDFSQIEKSMNKNTHLKNRKKGGSF